MSQSAASKHLKRLWNSIPLSRLKQGSTLNIRSTVPLTHVEIKTEWRDNGHVEFKQVFFEGSRSETTIPPAELTLSQLANQETSLGRIEACFAINLEPRQTTTTTPTAEKRVSPPKDLAVDGTDDDVMGMQVKEIERFVLDNGTDLPISDSKLPENIQQHGSELNRAGATDGISHLLRQSSSEEQEDSPGTFLSFQVPEKLNVVCELVAGGSIRVTRKLEGDSRLFTANGSVHVKKLRGHEVNIQAQGSNSLVYASDLIEAQNVSIETEGRVRAKQIHGHKVQIRVVQGNNDSGDHTDDTTTTTPSENDDEGSLIDISSLYVSGNGAATLQVQNVSSLTRRAVRVKTIHGPIRVETTNVCQPSQQNHMTEKPSLYPLVELGGVNGNCEVHLQETKARNAEETAASWASCLVHVDSFAPESVSLISMDAGDLHLTLDRKAEADLRLLSLPSAECLTECSAMLAEEEDSDHIVNILSHLPGCARKSQRDAVNKVSIETKAFAVNPAVALPENVDYIEGWVENKSAEPDSRFERKLHSSQGKIRVESAANQALFGFSEAQKKSTGNESEGENENDTLRALFAAVGTGRIRVETLSWLGAISRRYGMDAGPRGLGRTATRRGRAFVADDDESFENDEDSDNHSK